MPSAARAKRWCFTLNNYTAGEEEALKDLLESDHVTYGVYGRETGENNTPHLQGYFIWSETQTFARTKQLVGDRYHLEPSRGSPAQASDYCKKDGDYEEFGELKTSQGKRSDWDRFHDWCKEQNKIPTDYELFSAFPSLYGRYKKSLREICSMAIRVDSRTIGEPRGWQRQLEQRLELEPDDRHVRFIVDTEGNCGKSWFVKYYQRKYPNDCQIIPNGKRDDMALSYVPGKRVYFIDVPRLGMEFFQYPIVEMIKNGSVSSPKYESCLKETDEKAHVVVMCNEPPKMDALSADRYKIYEHNQHYN